MNGDHNVSKSDQQEVFAAFKEIVFCANENDLGALIQNLENLQAVQNNNKLKE